MLTLNRVQYIWPIWPLKAYTEEHPRLYMLVTYITTPIPNAHIQGHYTLDVILFSTTVCLGHCYKIYSQYFSKIYGIIDQEI